MVDKGGRPYVELARAQVSKIQLVLNHWGEATYRIPTLDPQGADAKLILEREVQIWRDGRLIFWGIPVAYRAAGDAAEFIAFGLLYYFATRYFGPVYSNAMPPALANGTFEAATVNAGWSSSSPAPTIASSTLHYSGSKSIKLTGGGTASPSTLYYIYQIVTMPTARSRPLTVTLSAWCYPESVTLYGYEDRGIEIQWNGTSPQPQEWALLNANVPQNVWTRLETSLVIPASAASTCTIGLFAPAGGSVYYDQVRFTWEQKTGAIAGEDWVDAYLRRIFDYGAGNTGGGGPSTTWWGATTYKSNLGMNFNGLTLAAGSLPVDIAWSHEDAGNIYEAMAECWKRDKADVEVRWNDLGTTRGLQPYTPRKGSYKPALALELGRNITRFSFDVDGRQSANDVRYIGRNSGNTKEVGQAGGPTPATLGGVQFESVRTPPQEVDGQGLIDLAATGERRLRAPVIVPTITVKAAGILDSTEVGGPLELGDTVPVRMNYGLIQENDVRRVVGMTILPATDEVELVLNTVS